MRYIKEVLKKNRIMVFVYVALGIFNAFMTNYKADYFQKVIDGLTNGKLAFAGIVIYGVILVVSYCMNYLDQYPEKKLEHGIYLENQSKRYLCVAYRLCGYIHNNQHFIKVSLSNQGKDFE